MPRRPRLDLPGIPSHLVQRGNNRQRCFRADADRLDYLAVLGRSSRSRCVQIHAYVLMDNHVHLLASATQTAAISRMMQDIGATYVRHFNQRHGRTGTLWEGRFHSSPVDSGAYLWNCHRYIELNPVRAGIARSPAQYRWSSHGFYATGRSDSIVEPRHEYLALGRSDLDRRTAFLSMFEAAMSTDELEAIRAHLRHERPLGSAGFASMVQSITGLPAEIRRAGRPRISAASRENLL